MALGIRGSNPIWSEVDLQGKLFDDTFYLFVLENDIPYIPATVYKDPDLNTPWTNPIRFLANGTLPIDIFYKEDTVYRLEYRQHIGSGMPTQQDPLIYEVDNYVPDSGGSSPINSVAFASSNQITNPQFSLVSLQNPVTISDTNPVPLEVAPGWFLLLQGTGTVTITQVPLNDTNINPSNAPYALRLTMNGWTTGSVILRQRFFQNGMLWANKIVSSAVTALINGAPQSISAILVDSNNSVLGTVLPLTPVNEIWNEYTGYAQLPASTNPNTPPSAYVDYQLLLPSNIDIYLTSFQIVVQDLPIQPSFDQDSINRQIDHTYNFSYPIIPIGAVIDFAGFIVPQHYYLCDGSAKNRIRNYLLLSAITSTQTVTLTSGVNTFTVTSNAGYSIGTPLEGTGIAASTTVTGVSGTTVTMSNNATATGPHAVTVFPWGNGDGSTTFNVPNFQGYITAGATGSLFPGINTIGTSGGESTHTLTIGEMPSHNHPPASGATQFSCATGSGIDNFNSGSQYGPFSTTGDTGGGGAHNNIQPTKLLNKFIRYE